MARPRSSAARLALALICLALAPAIGAISGEADFRRRAFRDRGRELLEKDTDHLSSLLQAGYLENMPMQDHLKEFAQRCSHIARLKTLGKSAKGFNIWALEITDKPARPEPEPAVRLVGNMHGNEPTGRVLTMAFAEWLCAHYDADEEVRALVDGAHLWLVPSMNPDGFAARKRENSNGVDLNRNFPDRLRDAPDLGPKGDEQPETAAMMAWAGSTRFVAALNFHEGALVANYPWDAAPDGSRAYQACPDDATFRHLAGTYAGAHATMAAPTNAEFPGGGTTNGAAWYSVFGSMQDWSYARAGTMEVTVEVSEQKWPAAEGLPALFEANLPAMLAFIRTAAFGGVRGRVVVETGALRKDKGKETAAVEANITIEGAEDFVVRSHPVHGDYYRPLAPGKYTVVVRREGYPTARSNVTVPPDGKGVVRDFVLKKAAGGGGGPGSKVVVTMTEAQQRQHNAVMVASGGGVMWGLWIIHRRMVQRSMAMGRQRSV